MQLGGHQCAFLLPFVVLKSSQQPEGCMAWGQIAVLQSLLIQLFLAYGVIVENNALHSGPYSLRFLFLVIFRWRKSEEKMVFHQKTGNHSRFIFCRNSMNLQGVFCLVCLFSFFLHICNVYNIEHSQLPHMERCRKPLNHHTWHVPNTAHTYIQQIKLYLHL